MNPISRIFWKEYRAQRSLWIALLAGVGLLQLIPAIVWQLTSSGSGFQGPGGPGDLMAAVAIVLTVAYICTCTAIMFAGETEDQTDGWLRTLPISTRQLIFGKLGFACVSTLAFAVLAALLTLVLASSFGLRITHEERSFLQLALSVGGYFLWGVFWSVNLRRVLASLAVSGIAASVVPALIIGIVDWFRRKQMVREDEPIILGVQAVLLICLAVIDYLLIRQWHLGLSSSRVTIPFVARIPKIFSLRYRLSGLLNWCLQRGTVGGRTWGVLFWNELTSAVPWLFWGMLAGLPVIWFTEGWLLGTGLTGWIIAGTIFSCGMATFRSDHAGGQIAFLGDRGVSPTKIWMTKTIVWGSVALLVSLAMLVTDDAACSSFRRLNASIGSQSLAGTIGEIGDYQNLELSSKFEIRARQFSLGGLWFLSCFAAGQLASFWVRRTALALVSGLILGILLIVWSLVTSLIDVPTSGAAWPLVLALPAGVWLTRRAWLDGRTGWKLRGIQIAGLIVPVVFCWSFAMAARVWQVADVDPGFAWKAHEDRLEKFNSAWSGEFVKLYQAGGEGLAELAAKIDPRDTQQILSPLLFSPHSPKEFDLTGLTRVILQKLDELQPLQPASGPMAEESSADAASPSGAEAGIMESGMEQMKTAPSTPEEQAEQLLAALKILRYLQTQVCSWHEWGQCCRAEQMVLARIRALAGNLSEHDEILQRLLKELQETLGPAATAVGARDMVMNQYVVWRQILERRGKFGNDVVGRELPAAASAIVDLAWGERERSLRLLNQTTLLVFVPNAAIRQVDLRRAVATTPWVSPVIHIPEIDMQPGTDRRGHWTESTYLDTWASERATVVIVALQIYRKNHGEFPESLNALKELNLAAYQSLLTDPWVNSQFGYFAKGDSSLVAELHDQPLLISGPPHLMQVVHSADGARKPLRLITDRVRFQLRLHYGEETNWNWPQQH